MDVGFWKRPVSFCPFSLKKSGMFEGVYARIWIQDNILFLEYRPNLVLNKKVARRVVKDRLRLQENKDFPVFCNSSGIIQTEPQALEYLAQEGSLLIKAIAFYTTSPLAKLLTRFFLETHRIKIPAKSFKDQNQAIKFLRPYTLSNTN